MTTSQPAGPTLRQLRLPVRTERLSLRPATWHDLVPTWEFRRRDDVAQWLTRAPATQVECRPPFMDRDSLRNSRGAVVTCFVYAFVSLPLLMLLVMHPQWFADLRLWVDASHAQEALLTGALNGWQWTQLGLTTIIFLLLLGVVGMRDLLLSEVK